MAAGSTAAAELRFPSCSGAGPAGSSPFPCAALRAVAVTVHASNAAAGRGLSTARSVRAAFRRKRRRLWPSAAAGGRCGAGWAAGCWWVTALPRAGQGRAAGQPSPLPPGSGGSPRAPPGSSHGLGGATSPPRWQLSRGRGAAGRGVAQPPGELGGRPGRAGPGLGPWAGPLSASPAAAWPPRLAVGAGCAGWPRRWCWRAPGCRFTAFGSSDRGCVALSDLTRFRGGGSLFWFKELCKHGFKEQIKSAGSCTACGRKFMIVFCVL